MSLEKEKPDRIIDVKGKICPYPLMETRDTLKELSDGEVLEVITDHKPAALETIPRFCEKMNYSCHIITENGFWRVVIKKEEEENE